MRKLRYLPLLMLFILAGCEGMPSLIMWHEDDSSEYQQGARSKVLHADSRVPLDVPSELRSKVVVPETENIAKKGHAEASSHPSVAHHTDVAGMAVSLHVRVYDQNPGQVISAVIDAMTALNLPVQSVDSPSGSVTTDWVRSDVSNKNSSLGTGIFGDTGSILRYRYVVRVLRMEASPKTRLEIRTLGQAYINRHWVNKKMVRKISNELFVSVEEQLDRHAVIHEES